MTKEIDKVVVQVGGIILGKELQIRLALACLIAKGKEVTEGNPWFPSVS